MTPLAGDFLTEGRKGGREGGREGGRGVREEMERKEGRREREKRKGEFRICAAILRDSE